MYYTNINNEELQLFHKQIKVTGDYEEINKLFPKAFKTDEAFKLIPLFYSDKIVANDNVTVLEDLCVLYANNTDLQSVYFQSNNPNFRFGVLHKIVTVNDKSYLKLHFYDAGSLFNVPNFSFNLQQDDVVLGDFVADNYGNINLEITGAGKFTVTANNQIISWED